MSTTRSTAARGARPLPPVVPLAPRSLARRAAVLQARVRVRRTFGVAHEELFLDVIDDTLARTHGVHSEDHATWARLIALVEEHRDLSHTLPACAATANLVGLALFGGLEDHTALTALADELGHVRLARLQHRYGTALETDSRLPLTTTAMRRMLVPRIGRRLGARPRTPALDEAFDDTRLRAAHALLVQGIDRDWTVPTLESVDELADIVANGTIAEWRHHLAMVLADPWSPYPDRIVDLARQVGRAQAAVVAALVELCRDQQVAAADRTRPHPATQRYRYPGGRVAP
ncbi:hypothetical protein ACFFOS_26940 [Nocardioides kongjuensis]|uniref:Uncharacterized protein n=1 Tax=Nocardioides kongjuensis TaxID=349522 RepID=A0A852RRB4_9ACTN|nr:hypothetical protein [Nocardioides kongjuensis]NYD31400.1 hypothetical protein [Nocardioides kongjuensis]